LTLQSSLRCLRARRAIIANNLKLYHDLAPASRFEIVEPSKNIQTNSYGAKNEVMDRTDVSPSTTM